jgi:hydrogenase maturation protease
VTIEPANVAPAGLLVIGYGNELRCDDGVGPKVAAAVAEWNSAGVRALACHQLTPELAEPIASANQVIFVDAAADSSGTVQLRQIEPIDGAEVMTHSADPRCLLGLAKHAFGHSPVAWSLTIPTENLGFGEELSPLARQGWQIALDKIRTLAASP